MDENYRTLADAIAADIASGRLGGGDRLPPQREFARLRGIAVSTASRVYAELIRRGLATGEVGRGTFVRSAAESLDLALAEPARGRVDLEYNFPMPLDQTGDLAPALERLMQPTALNLALRPIGAAATPEARSMAAALLSRGSWRADPANIVFTGNGRQAIAAAFAAIATAGTALASRP